MGPGCCEQSLSPPVLAGFYRDSRSHHHVSPDLASPPLSRHTSSVYCVSAGYSGIQSQALLPRIQAISSPDRLPGRQHRSPVPLCAGRASHGPGKKEEGGKEEEEI